ncbi:hypothetical protein CUPS4066_07110 [Campylobacter upsaliensis]|uniref:hypothetical protein n=1 Tax=Campylobacter upsaliensis TaxID=28080 RepID=UPI00214A830A|nr:hypothetical protein [Campylobacter upsaliensis]MCR2102245.1 hypothetical protein [Campylobacter upsaliensis]MCR2108470.1 hypothetical protein [Campylobacter upsaliensis]
MSERYKCHKETLSIKSQKIKDGLKNHSTIQILLCQGIMYDWDYIEKCCDLTKKGDIYDFLSACFNEEKQKLKQICEKLKEFKNDSHALKECCEKKL